MKIKLFFLLFPLLLLSVSYDAVSAANKYNPKAIDVIVDGQGNIIVDGKPYTPNNGKITVDNNNVYVDGKQAKKANAITFDTQGKAIVDGKPYTPDNGKITVDGKGNLYRDGKRQPKQNKVNADSNGIIYVDGKVYKNVGTANNSSSNNEACAAVVCLTDLKKAFGKECNDSIKKYFKIKKKRHGHYSPDRTFNARSKWLDQCKEARNIDKGTIQALYGVLPDRP